MSNDRSPQSHDNLIPVGYVLCERYVVERVMVQRPLVVTYRAYDLVEAKYVVVEVLDDALVQDSAMLQRIQEEAGRARELSHANIVPFHGLEQDNDLLFGVRDYVDGVTLSRYLGRLNRPPVFYEAMQVVEQAGMALDHAHRTGVLHRAVSPKSIVLRYDGRVVVLGLNLPSLAGISADADLDPAYLSPEQCAGGKVDHRTDVYSLAVVAYVMCAGQPPFTGREVEDSEVSDWEKVCWQHVNQPPVFASKLNRDLPKEIGWVLSKALAKRPSERFRSTAEFVVLMKRAWKEAGLDPAAMCVEPPPWISEPEVVTPPRIARPRKPRPYRDTQRTAPQVETKRQKIHVVWLAGLFLVVAAVWAILFAFVFGNYEEKQPGIALSQGPTVIPGVPAYAVPTWTPPLIPTPTGTRTILSANMLEFAAPTVAVPSGIPFNGLRGLTDEFNWADYAGNVSWRAYTDPRFGFALMYPDGWEIEPGMNVLRLYMPERDVGIIVCSCGTRVADSGQWVARVLELLRNDFPDIEQLEQRIFKPGWLATLARVPQGESDDIQLAILSFGQSERGYAVVFVAWSSDWQGVKPIFDQMAENMRFP